MWRRVKWENSSLLVALCGWKTSSFLYMVHCYFLSATGTRRILLLFRMNLFWILKIQWVSAINKRLAEHSYNTTFSLYNLFSQAAFKQWCFGVSPCFFQLWRYWENMDWQKLNWKNSWSCLSRYLLQFYVINSYLPYYFILVVSEYR